MECRELVSVYDDDRRFRKRIVMEKLGFGAGEYSYFANPLPRVVRELRTHAYRRLAPIADRWMRDLRRPGRFPPTLGAFLRRCAARGQRKPTPLLLRYGAGGYNRLHQDLYGDVAFPLQLTVFLSRPCVDYEGGEFLLVESPPRMQSRGKALAPGLGEMVVFPSAERPIAGPRGFFAARVRHGVATVRRGSRMTLGIIFHDAR